MALPNAISVSSTINSPIILQKAADLAKKLDLPLVAWDTATSCEFVLAYTPDGLKFLQILPSGKLPHCLLFVDLTQGKNGYRLAKQCTTKQPLARAVGIRPGKRPSILEGTGGLGGDAFVLASLGCQVTICERSPIVAALLEDGLQRAALSPQSAEIVTARMHLIVRDTIAFLQHGTDVFSTIYLDPMYPHRLDSALNRLAMRTIRTLVGDDEDSGTLLETALAKATNRVVVKRPANAPPLANIKPTHVISMKNSRFDIYLTFME